MTMRKRLVQLSVLAVLPCGLTACSSMMFWRDTLIVGKVQLVTENGAPVSDRAPTGVSINFINVTARLEESVLSAQSDAQGKYRSPKLLPGRYKIEAMLPGYVIESAEAQVKGHQHKKVPFVLKKIGEARGRSVRESDEENIPNPGEVQIMPPPF
jgi:hypothetical protein